MSEQPEVIDTQLTLHFGATLAINGGTNGFSDWIKPEASYSMKWNGIPSEEQIRLATQFIQKEVLSPILEEIIGTAQERLTEARRNR
jgi:hypothetical protein